MRSPCKREAEGANPSSGSMSSKPLLIEQALALLSHRGYHVNFRNREGKPYLTVVAQLGQSVATALDDVQALWPNAYMTSTGVDTYRFRLNPTGVEDVDSS